MTDLRKAVHRRTIEAAGIVRRRLVVALLPGDVIGFREEGRRKWYTAPIPRVFIQVARWNAEADAAEKRQARKAGKQ